MAERSTQTGRTSGRAAADGQSAYERPDRLGRGGPGGVQGAARRARPRLAGAAQGCRPDAARRARLGASAQGNARREPVDGDRAQARGRQVSLAGVSDSEQDAQASRRPAAAGGRAVRVAARVPPDLPPLEPEGPPDEEPEPDEPFEPAPAPEEPVPV